MGYYWIGRGVVWAARVILVKRYKRQLIVAGVLGAGAIAAGAYLASRSVEEG